MNKQGALFVVVLSALVAGGGVVMSTANAAVTVTPQTIVQVGRYSTVESAQTGSAVDGSFLISVRAISAGSNIARIADADVIAMGHTFCSASDAGISAADFKTSADLMDIPRGTYRAVLATSEAFYCPSHLGVSF